MLYTAVLLTSYNRVQTTLKCLKHFFEAERPENIEYEVFLVDDASPDKTGEIVKQHYPQVNVIHGTGSLYWCGGMRLAWECAAKAREYDFYLWLNDDTVLLDSALITLINDYSYISKRQNNSFFAICGACREPVLDVVSYSGSDTLAPVKLITPDNDVPQVCKFMCGNVVLVTKETFNLIGGMSKLIQHRFGDYDYSARINRAGGVCFVSSRYAGVCHNEVFKCFNSETHLIKRLKMLHSPAGLGLKDDIYFKLTYNNRNWFKWSLTIIYKYIMSLSPSLYSKIKRFIIR